MYRAALSSPARSQACKDTLKKNQTEPGQSKEQTTNIRQKTICDTLMTSISVLFSGESRSLRRESLTGNQKAEMVLLRKVQTSKSFYQFMGANPMPMAGKQDLDGVRKHFGKWQFCALFLYVTIREQA